MITNKSTTIRLGVTQSWPIKSASLVWFQYHLNARLKLFFQKYFDDKFFQNRGISFSHVLLKFVAKQLHLEVFLHDSKLYDFYSTKPAHKAVVRIRGPSRRKFYRKIYIKHKFFRSRRLRLFKNDRTIRNLSAKLSAFRLRRSSSLFINNANKNIINKNFGKLSSNKATVEALLKKSYFFKKRFHTVARWFRFFKFKLRRKRRVKLYKPVATKGFIAKFGNFRFNYLLSRRRSKLVDFLEYKSRKKFNRYMANKKKFFSKKFNKFKRLRFLKKFRFNKYRAIRNRKWRRGRYNRKQRRRFRYFSKYKKKLRKRRRVRFSKFFARAYAKISRIYVKVTDRHIKKLHAQTIEELRHYLTFNSVKISPIFRRFTLKRLWAKYHERRKDILIKSSARRRRRLSYLRSLACLRKFGLRRFGKKRNKFFRKNLTKLKRKRILTKSRKKYLNTKGRVVFSNVKSKKKNKFIKTIKSRRKKSNRSKFKKKKFFFNKRRGAPVTSSDSRADRFVFFNQYSAFSAKNFVRYRFYHFLAKFLSAQIYITIKLPITISFSFFPTHRAGSDFYLNFITAKLYYRYILSDIIKPIVKMSITFYRGFVVNCKGRFTRAQIAVSKKFVKRSVSYSRINSLLDYGQRAVVLKYGTCNLRIWIRK